MVFRYWGKAKPEQTDGSTWHLLPYHCLDVAAVAAAWWDASPTVRRSFCTLTPLGTDQVKAWVLFFVALHDYGKFDVRFQLLVKNIWTALYPDVGSYRSLPSMEECKSYYHGNAGLYWFKRDHGDLLGVASDPGESDFSFLDYHDDSDTGRWHTWKDWIEAVTGHHGYVRKDGYIVPAPLPIMCDPRLSQVDLRARKEWLNVLEKLCLHPAGLSLNDSPPPCSPLMAGFCSVSDWLGSRCDSENFPLLSEPQDLSAYFTEKYANDAVRVLAMSGVVGTAQHYAGVSSLLMPKQKPRSLQTLVDSLPIQSGLTLMEASTGSGKTEAALAYAWKLLAEGLADSIVFALPTQATANAMLERLERIAPLLFAENPNLILAHGLARFNEKFVALKRAAHERGGDEDGWVQCSQWLAESRKRIFLGQIGVCTVDQVLISVLPVKHRFVRGFGVGRSILIVDEVHAYDAYMYGLLEEVLEQQRATGGSAILLSATLPESMRIQLLNAWGVERGPDHPEVRYPLITWTAGKETVPFVISKRLRPGTVKVKLETVNAMDIMPDDHLLQRVIDAARSGAQVALICNLVDDAQKLALKLRQKTDVPVYLFHARYCYAHRRMKELSIIKHFGPKGKRSTGRILVATQVVEQSLDIDFDWIITQLCPIDLLFQRIGRLHRHKRRRRPPGLEKPLCTVILPPAHDYGLHGLIYANTRALWRTSQKILTASEGFALFPEAYRTWIEDVYCEDAWGIEPAEIEEQYKKFIDDFESSRYGALQMIASAANPLPDSDQAITAVTRDGEMNLTLLPVCSVAEGTLLMDGTLLEALEKDRRPETLVLNSIGVPASWRNYLGESDEEGRFRLHMKKAGDYFTALSKGMTFHYHYDIGMEKEK
ncbi:MAG: CRISPR-associated helicase/endonuclease Cas3 [Nitrospirota bacterium]